MSFNYGNGVLSYQIYSKRFTYIAWEIKINGFNKETKLFLFFFYVKPRAVTLHDKGDRSKEIL